MLRFHDLPLLLKLNPSTLCRVEFWDPIRQQLICLDKNQWSFLLQEPLHEPFEIFLQTVARLRTELSDLWALQGIDSLGILRSLFLSESASPQSGEWLRMLGFVHLLTASGLHLLALFSASEMLFKKLFLGFSAQKVRALHRVFNGFVFFSVWTLQGFRSGFLRPFLMVGLKILLTEQGMKIKPHRALIIAVVTDAIWSWFWSSVLEQTPWGAGRWHYFLAVWGGAFGWFWAQDQKWSAFRSHLAMSVFSWLATMPLEFLHGNFSPLTPILSFVTIPVIAVVLYPLTFVGIAIGDGFLQVIAMLWNRSVSELAVFLTNGGAWREVTPLQAGTSLFLASVFVITVRVFRRRRYEHRP